MNTTHEQILEDAVPGSEFNPPRHHQVSGVRIERPRKYWRSQGTTWAVYNVAGDRVGETVVTSVQKAKTIGINPLLVVRDNTELGAVAARYADLLCHVACPIAGRGSLIPPLSLPPTGRRHNKSATRIPVALLHELGTNPVIPRALRGSIHRLAVQYQRFNGKGSHDEAENVALMAFMKSQLLRMGFRNTGNNSPDMIRQLEIAGWGGRRDHFFHSFQNYFFGLYAVAHLSSHFTGYRQAASLHWNIDSYHVWLIASLWHDVGYGVAHLEDIHNDVMGTGAESSATSTRVEFLKSPLVKDGLLNICTLMARLLKPVGVRTEWMKPVHWPRGNAIVSGIRSAFEASVMQQGHGAPSALRLYNDFVPHIRRLGPAKHDVLEQVILMACASLPFHDDNFRDHLRETIGSFVLDTKVMPFATLLAFVDSIQDDRRDLTGIKDEVRFLEKILILAPATVTAQVNQRSLSPQSVLWKAVEARDVFAHLQQDATSLSFKYPDWMVI